MNYKNSSLKTYSKFCDKDGNMHIASDYALEKVVELVDNLKVQNILEVGLGIGSISDILLNFAKKNNLKIQYSGTESNNFCLTNLPFNVNYFKEIKLFKSLNDLEIGQKYDLIIVDGSDSSLENISQHCAEHAMIFIEGGRDVQVDVLKKLFANSLSTRLMSLRRPPEKGPFQQRWAGGATVIATNPTLVQKKYIFQEKFKTFANRRLRRIL